MSLWQKLFGGGQSEPADHGVAGGNPRGEGSEHELPYHLGQRPGPEGEDLDVLLPPQVGSYIREPVKTPARINRPIYANYRSGAATVFVELGICDDARGAQMALATAKAETDAEFPDVPQVFLKGRGVSCLRTVNRLGAFMAWTRDRYYFSAHAKGGEADLDAFMEAFPYEGPMSSCRRRTAGRASPGLGSSWPCPARGRLLLDET
jgi:hypothetical protein